MQAKLYTQTTYESVLDWNHGGGSTTYRIAIDLGISKSLVLSIQKSSELIHASWGFDAAAEEDAKFIKEIEVPQDILDVAIGFIEARTAFEGQIDRLKALAE